MVDDVQLHARVTCVEGMGLVLYRCFIQIANVMREEEANQCGPQYMNVKRHTAGVSLGEDFVSKQSSSTQNNNCNFV